MSVRPSTLCADCICSGDMYSIDTIPAADWVMRVSPTTCEMPKSRTLIALSPLRLAARKRLLGLTSRWMMPAAWASATAAHAWRT